MHKLGLNTTQSLGAHENSETNVRMEDREVEQVVGERVGKEETEMATVRRCRVVHGCCEQPRTARAVRFR
jgi:hypothetical protein